MVASVVTSTIFTTMVKAVGSQPPIFITTVKDATCTMRGIYRLKRRAHYHFLASSESVIFPCTEAI